jgi:hypothetical protein
VFPELITPYNQPIHTVQDVWNSGLTLSGDQPCLGHRPLISTNPPKYDNKYHWITYKQADERRKALGSTLHQWFASGKLLRAEGGYECVGIWSANRPGTLLFPKFVSIPWHQCLMLSCELLNARVTQFICDICFCPRYAALTDILLMFDLMSTMHLIIRAASNFPSACRVANYRSCYSRVWASVCLAIRHARARQCLVHHQSRHTEHPIHRAR